MPLSASSNVTCSESLQWVGQFIDPETERAFRKDQLGHDFSVAKVVLLVNAFGVAAFVSSDFQLFGGSHPFPALVGLRLALLVLTVLVWRSLQSATRERNPRRFDAALAALCICMAFAQAYVGLTRPASYTGHFLVHLVTILLVYCAVPLRLRLQALPAILMSAGVAAVLVAKPPSDGLTTFGIIWMLVGANVLGACVSRQLQISKRRQFLAYTQAVDARSRLEDVLAELKTLRGIIPICAHCKHVPNDAGSWEQLELYVSRHSDANFSHGICPACARLHFGDYLDFDPDHPRPSNGNS